ncbi:uncharacterized protein N7459_008302 [Penicillium hispanicum]|uniref:uncharacterized protein n=1 Tax=Penicillium hispanicum TaxID=1080232 RepID=UPI00253FCD5B|nr:uncharacterized protein N7459_008302 [Penicillium hispanicum]KAJ5573875.1 hypothetical protein N7459_008302 [Penicillium hispanicum]
MLTPMWTLFSFLSAFSFLCSADSIFQVNVENSWAASEATLEVGITAAKPDDKYKDLGDLLTQPILGQIEQYTWPPAALENLAAFKELRSKERPVRKDGETFRILLVYPSTKEVKNEPLRKWIEPQINAVLNTVLGEGKYTYDPTPATFKVGDTGVGEQPYNQMGPLGAWNRIRYCVDHLEDEPAEDHNSKPGAYSNYHAIIVLSLESSITSKEEGGYDSPNVVIYEVYSGYVLAARGAGPAVQQKLLDYTLQQYKYDNDLSEEIRDLCGAVTYGNVLKMIYGVSDSNWHINQTGGQKWRLLTPFLDDHLPMFLPPTGSSAPTHHPYAQPLPKAALADLSALQQLIVRPHYAAFPRRGVSTEGFYPWEALPGLLVLLLPDT